LARSILPKLHNVLRSEFTVNPSQQFVDPFRWVMEWTSLIPSRVMIQLLRMEFFPKWFKALHLWLLKEPNFEEVSKWYLGWKSLLPDLLKDSQDIKQLFNRGLDLMNMSLSNPQGLGGLFSVIEGELRNPGVPLASVKPAPAPVRPAEEPGMSFKDIVQKFAALNGVEFVPNVRRGHVDGKAIFNFGRVSIYLDNRTIFASQLDTQSGSWIWQPTSLQDLLPLAR